MTDTRVAFPQPCDQAWETMPEQGCHRRCDACDQTIFDLEKLTVDEAEALLDSQPEVCVRARVAPDGRVATAPSSSKRALKTAFGAAATLALAACATTNSAGETATYSVSGKVPWDAIGWTFELVGDTETHRSRPTRNRSFRFKDLEAGVYRLNLVDSCDERFDLGEVNVTAANVKLGEIKDIGACVVVIVGKMERDKPPSLG